MIDCCAPILEERLSVRDAESLAERFRALGDPVRLRVLSLVAERGEVCACELVGTVPVSQPTLSHHLKVLREAGLLASERRGRWIYYRTRPETIAALRGVLGVTVTNPLGSLAAP